MFERYQARIEAYCEKNGVEIPVGFYRHPACRYVAIDLESLPAKLYATTWVHEADAIQFLASLAEGHSLRMLDFKEKCEVTYQGATKLHQGEPI